ncbi:MAG: ribonuclease H-like domain-containing protein [Ignavibacteria bacterium]
MIDITQRKILVFDIEVVAYDFEALNNETQEYLTRYARTFEERQYAIENMVFSPFTSQIVAIGMLNKTDNVGGVLINAEEKIKLESNLPNITYYCYDEKSLLKQFWSSLKEKDYTLFVTFNGREFDCPFLMLRSLVLGVRPSKNLMLGSDFTFREHHIDLLKEFTFHKHSPSGARRKFSLDFYCKQLGIKSPKSRGISGASVGELYRDRKYQQIADYCMEDVLATAKLFDIWNKILNL